MAAYQPESLGKYIDILYQQRLGKESDPAGRSYWMQDVMSGTTPLHKLGGVMSAAAQEYEPGGAKATTRAMPALPLGMGAPDIFQPGLYPTATSISGTQSRTGMDWGSPFMKQVSPMLTAATKELPGVIGKMGETLQDRYKSLMGTALRQQAFQGTLNQLAGRNILDSSVAASALAQTAVPIMQQIGDIGFQSALAQQQAQVGLPSMLAQIAGLGQTGVSAGGAISRSQDPLAPYKLLSQFLLA